MPQKTPSISVFFPAYKDSQTIGELVETALQVLSELADDYEVIVVNDGSPDNTGQVIDTLVEKYPAYVKAVHHPQNRGYGGALKSGFANATKDLVFYTDGDAQYDVRELKQLLEKMAEHVDLVNGWKTKRQDPIHRIWIGKLYQYGVKAAFALKIRDVDCDFRLMRRAIFDVVTLESNSGLICVEMIKKVQEAGFRLAEVPVHHYPRRYGRSQFFSLRRVSKTLLDLSLLWWTLTIKSKWFKVEGNRSAVFRN
jgi:glycosyltransferase involved in cell wall biosynthesis